MAPTSYFIHSDFMSKTENLLNGKPSNLLAKFSIRGKQYENIDYVATPHHVLCDIAFGDTH